MENQVLNPPVPCICVIPKENFVPGKLIRIQGAVPDIAYRFNINLQCGPGTHPQSDIALQVSVRIIDGYISINSLGSGIWGKEELGDCLIQCRQNFEIILLCDLNHYKIAINGQHYCELPQRINYTRVTHLAIDGDVSLSQISYESLSAESAPPLTPGNEFEVVDSSSVPLLRGHSPVPQPSSSHPPDYNTAVSGIPPYPTNTAPGAPGVSPRYPDFPDQTQRSPYPVMGIHPPPPAGVYAPLSHPNASMPLNAPMSRIRPMTPIKEDTSRKYAFAVFATIVAILFIIAIIVAKVFRNKEIHGY